MLDTKDKAFLKSCHFGPENPYCPIFRLGSVVSWTGSNFQEIALQVGSVHSGALPGGSRAQELWAWAQEEGGEEGDPWGWVVVQSPLPQGLTVFRISSDAQPVRTQALSETHSEHLLFGS